MAVEDKYTDSLISGSRVTKLLKAINAQGMKVHEYFATFELAAADDNGSVYRVFKDLDPHIIPLAILPANDEIAAGTNFDIGLYESDLGAVVDKDCFAEGLDFRVAHGFGMAPRRWTEVFRPNNGGTLADNTTYKGFVLAGEPAKIVDVSVIAETVPVGGTNTVKVLNGSSAGNTVLGAASFDPTALTANQATKVALTATAADRALAASGAGSAAYVEWVTGNPQTTDAVNAAVAVTFESLFHGMNAVVIENFGKTLYEHAGHTILTKKRAYDLAFTADTVGTAAGTVSVILLAAVH